MTARPNDFDKDMNRDPITGAPGAHPAGTAAGAAIGAVAGAMAGKGAGEVVNPSSTDKLGHHHLGTGVGAGSGAAVGAALGAAGGPIGVAAGAAIGAIAGGLAGKGVAVVVNPAAEDAYWNGSYSTTPYYVAGRTFDDYAPAYRLGYTSRGRYPSYEAAERELSNDWARVKGQSRLSWEEATHATRDAWHRGEGAMPGDVHGDGR